MSAPEEPQRLPIRVFEEIINGGNLETTDEVVAPGFRFNSPSRPEPYEGAEGFKEFVTNLRRGFPDLEVTIDHVVTDTDHVAIRSHVTGTHLGVYRGIPPTGRRIEQSQLHMFRLDDGKIGETWQEIDGLGVMQQLGIFPRGEPPTFLLRIVIGVQRLVRRR